jgi:hypothetical protein
MKPEINQTLTSECFDWGDNTSCGGKPFQEIVVKIGDKYFHTDQNRTYEMSSYDEKLKCWIDRHHVLGIPHTMRAFANNEDYQTEMYREKLINCIKKTAFDDLPLGIIENIYSVLYEM